MNFSMVEMTVSEFYIFFQNGDFNMGKEGHKDMLFVDRTI